MPIEGINNSYISPFDNETAVTVNPNTAVSSSASEASAAPSSVDVAVSLSPQAQQLAQDSISQQTVAQTDALDTGADLTTASQFGANATANNSSVAAGVNGASGDTLNAAPSNSSQSASVASQYNISPESALGQTIDFSA
ncbi:hypothetical protein [Marinomonas ostreistagni]|uniref:Uncharacterized protein n=1 Tax=Marinomonas ostreistagni TaxID=359209 RepID=A0ABS0ZBP5_9GAMM|nr:hypothetical protein [Marinomonas ostreistagni]MBJ7551083.1 hypothetical protein [Marinomonas ostreistagni]